MSSIIKLTNINKSFKIPYSKQDSLREFFVNWNRAKNYKRLKVLQGLNLEVKSGEWLGIIGANGSGKSTLLKIIAGIYEPDSGQVLVEGKLVPFLELGVGFNPDLSARDNIYLNGVILGMTRSKITEKFDTIVNFAGIGNFVNQKLKNFSTGMQVRLGFSIAFQAHGDIYLLDEILAVGDYQFQQKTDQVFRKMKLQGRTVILISHSLDNVKKYCDRVAWLDQGRITKIGTPEKVIRQYTH